MTTFRVGCVVDKESISFPISISSEETVGELKDKIKRTLSPRFDNIPAMNLTLWRVDIPDEDLTLTKDKAGDNEEGVSTKDGIVLAKNMDIVRASDHSTYSASQLTPPMRTIRRFFLQPPTADIIHVIIQAPTPGIGLAGGRDVRVCATDLKSISIPWTSYLAFNTTTDSIGDSNKLSYSMV
ncbi:MAG: hypothetical protein J3Q66DRAFT_370879 [Benniella sp.]|nr:MAG: hypothetical protein J3Q66DRAFT_370879 [Benniella sp.]